MLRWCVTQAMLWLQRLCRPKIWEQIQRVWQFYCIQHQVFVRRIRRLRQSYVICVPRKQAMSLKHRMLELNKSVGRRLQHNVNILAINFFKTDGKRNIRNHWVKAAQKWTVIWIKLYICWGCWVGYKPWPMILTLVVQSMFLKTLRLLLNVGWCV